MQWIPRLSDPIDTASAGDRLVLHLIGALAEFERSLIVERTQAGLQTVKRRARKLGRPAKLTAAQIVHARAPLVSGENGSTVASSFGVARSTLYEALRPPHETECKPLSGTTNRSGAGK